MADGKPDLFVETFGLKTVSAIAAVVTEAVVIAVATDFFISAWEHKIRVKNLGLLN